MWIFYSKYCLKNFVPDSASVAAALLCSVCNSILLPLNNWFVTWNNKNRLQRIPAIGVDWEITVLCACLASDWTRSLMLLHSFSHFVNIDFVALSIMFAFLCYASRWPEMSEYKQAADESIKTNVEANYAESNCIQFKLHLPIKRCKNVINMLLDWRLVFVCWSFFDLAIVN